MGGACPSRAFAVPVGGWYFEQRNTDETVWFHLVVSVSVSGGARGSGHMVLPDGVEVRFDHKPGQLRRGRIQMDGSIEWDNGKTWKYDGGRAWSHRHACVRRWSGPDSSFPAKAGEAGDDAKQSSTGT